MKLVRILKNPVITEKAMAAQTNRNRYTFVVDPRATAGSIKDAIEKTYGVNVLSLNTTRVAGKRRRVGKMRRSVVKEGGKKAIVELKAGQKIEVIEA